MVGMTGRLLAAIGAAALAGLAVSQAAAQEGKDFYVGKTVTYVVATKPGGGYDTNGRLVAEYMQKHLPGSTFIVQNMPGAGHIIGANFIYNSEPDGLTIGTFNTGLIYGQLKGDDAIKFDLANMSWIGKVASEPRGFVVSKESGIETFDDIVKSANRIKFAAAGVGSASTVETTMLVNNLSLPVDIITGYNGDDDQLAMRRGEVQGIFGSRSSFQRFVDEGHGKFVALIGGSDSSIPQLGDIVDNAEAQKAIALIESQSNIARLTAGPPGIPEDRLQALRDAFAAATSDPEFLEKAKSLDLPVDPAVGDDVAMSVKSALDQPQSTIDFIRASLTEE